jgi:hypothetical protein
MEIYVTGQQMSGEDMDKAMKAPASELPKLTDQQAKAADAMQVPHERWARYQLAGQYSKERLKKTAERMAATIERELAKALPNAKAAESDGIQYNDVSWAAIAQLKYPVAKPLRKNWTAEQVAEITPFEGEALRTTGYLVAFKPQSGGSGEGTNCHLTARSDTDTHMALVEGVGDAEKTSVVIEFTPRFLKAHPNWTKSSLSPWLNSDDPVRISGWLMLDPDHRNHLNRFRSTLWEIHPITKIEVWKENQWVDLDKMR